MNTCDSSYRFKSNEPPLVSSSNYFDVACLSNFEIVILILHALCFRENTIIIKMAEEGVFIVNVNNFMGNRTSTNFRYLLQKRV